MYSLCIAYVWLMYMLCIRYVYVTYSCRDLGSDRDHVQAESRTRHRHEAAPPRRYRRDDEAEYGHVPINAAATAYCAPAAVAYCAPEAVAYCGPAAVAYCGPAAVAYCAPAAVAYCRPAAEAYFGPAATAYGWPAMCTSLGDIFLPSSATAC